MASTNLPEGLLISKIYVVRGQSVMLDEDLAGLYGVKTKRLNEQVGRNAERFPEDFMFRLTADELDDLRSQNATSSWGGRRTPPYAFTEHGVLMLSSVLRSARAVEVNIRIMRLFTRMRQLLVDRHDMAVRIERIEAELRAQGDDLGHVYEYVKRLMDQPTPAEPEPPRRRIGFTREDHGDGES